MKPGPPACLASQAAYTPPPPPTPFATLTSLQTKPCRVCGRFVQVWDAQLQRFVQVYLPTWKEEETVLKDIQSQLSRGYNVPPTRKVLSLAAPGGTPKVEMARWGFRVTIRAESGMPVEREVFNTRIEEAYEKPMWKGLVGKSHAVVPVQGFYEWSGPPSLREPHFITRADGELMLMAAVTGMRDTPTGRDACVSVVTCGPNAFMEPIHNRMPVILEPGKVDDWLHPESLGTEGVLDLAVPTNASLREHRVSERVNSVENNDADLVKVERGGQMRLF